MTATDLLQMALTDDNFGEEQGGGFRFLGQILTIEVIPGKPEFNGGQPSEQLHYMISNLGWYKDEAFTLAVDRPNRQEWATIKLTKDGKWNKRTKFGVVMRSFAELIPGVSFNDLDGRVLWWEPTTIEFGTDKDGKPMTAKDVLLPVAVPTAEELKGVEHLVGATAAAMSAAAPAEPEADAFTMEETLDLLLFYVGKTAKVAQLEAIKSTTMSQSLKQSVMSGKAVGILIAQGLLVSSSKDGTFSATDKASQLAVQAA